MPDSATAPIAAGSTGAPRWPSVGRVLTRVDDLEGIVGTTDERADARTRSTADEPKPQERLVHGPDTEPRRHNGQAWLAEHPRIHVHFTPTHASWRNLVE
jgi:hypothetical protein